MRIAARNADEVGAVLEGLALGTGVQEFEEGRPTSAWEDLTGVLHCGKCGAYCLELLGEAECCDCFERGEEVEG